MSPCDILGWKVSMLSPLHLRTEDAEDGVESPPSCQLDQASRAAIAAPATQSWYIQTSAADPDPGLEKYGSGIKILQTDFWELSNNNFGLEILKFFVNSV